jgi:acyl-CoA thioester hydrolase
MATRGVVRPKTSNADGPSRPFETHLEIRVGTYEIDYAGHVSNQVYLRWCEDLRLQLLEEYFPLEELMAEGYMPVLIASEIRYHKPVKLFDKPVGSMWMDKLSGVTMEFAGEFKVGETLCTSVRHTGLFVNTKTMKPSKLPARLLQMYRDWPKNNDKESMVTQ